VPAKRRARPAVAPRLGWRADLEVVPAGFAVPAPVAIPEERSPRATTLFLARVPRWAALSPVPSRLGYFSVSEGQQLSECLTPLSDERPLYLVKNAFVTCFASCARDNQ